MYESRLLVAACLFSLIQREKKSEKVPVKVGLVASEQKKDSSDPSRTVTEFVSSPVKLCTLYTHVLVFCVLAPAPPHLSRPENNRPSSSRDR